MLNKKSRISNRLLLAKLLKRGDLYRTRIFSVRYFPSLEKNSRFAVVVSGKNVKKAVDRNHMRRQITEAIRLSQSLLKFPIVATIMLKPHDKPLKYKALED